MTAQSRLRTPEELHRIMLRTNPDGSNVYLSDVARVELGSENYSFQARYNGKPAAGFRISLAPGANALDTVDAVKAKVAEVSQQFPPDIRVDYPLDTTPFVKLSLEQRSEEHTSELPSLMRISYAVFCLKKKKNPRQ